MSEEKDRYEEHRAREALAEDRERQRAETRQQREALAEETIDLLLHAVKDFLEGKAQLCAESEITFRRR